MDVLQNVNPFRSSLSLFEEYILPSVIDEEAVAGPV
jgi:hypothetical protein